MNIKSISIELINKDFSSFGGIKINDIIYNLLKFRENLSVLLPAKKKRSPLLQEKKFKSLIFKFICGGDYLGDLDLLKLDKVFLQLLMEQLLLQLLVSFYDHLKLEILKSMKNTFLT